MRKLSEIKNEDAISALAQLLGPIATISKDEAVKQAVREKDRLKAIETALQNHPKAVLKILATLDGEPIETYETNLLQIPVKVMEIFNDEDMMAFFRSQGLVISDTSSGSATENTEEAETK